MSEATPILLDCDPGHDDAIALLLALASPELELLGVTTVAGNQTLEKTTANALRVLELVGRGDVDVAAGADRPLARELFIAAYVHGETGLDGPSLLDPQRQPVDQHAVDFLAERILGSVGRSRWCRSGPDHVALCSRTIPRSRSTSSGSWSGGARSPRGTSPPAEFNIYVAPSGLAVFHAGFR